MTALEMRWDLRHWDQALKLAHTLAPQRVSPLYLRMYVRLHRCGGKSSSEGTLYTLHTFQRTSLTCGLTSTARLQPSSGSFNAPKKVPELCVEYGQQLEFRGSNDDALAMFESALSESGSSSSAEEEKLASSASGAAAAVGGNDDEEEEDIVVAREQEARRAVCLAGIARCTLRSGDLRKGLRLARRVG